MTPPSKPGPLGTLIAEYLNEEDILESGILANRNPLDIFESVQDRMKSNETKGAPSKKTEPATEAEVGIHRGLLLGPLQDLTYIDLDSEGSRHPSRKEPSK